VALAVVARVALDVASVEARGDRVSRRERLRNPPPPPVEPPSNVHLEPAGSIALPGRGQSLAWAPDGRRIAVGGHFREKVTRLRYDTRVANVESGTLLKSFACHWYWTVAHAWIDHPDYGALLADGGADHAVKLWNPDGRGSTKCNPGQFLPADGAVKQLGEIDGWITSLAFSPAGRWLAGASRDRTIRVWQIHLGPTAWRVVALWFDQTVGNFLSVDWAPDGRALVSGDRRGNVVVWDFDPERDRWDDATIADFADYGYETQVPWFRAHPTLTTRVPRWSESGHKVIWNARWSPDGTRVAAAGEDGMISVYEAATGAVLMRQTLPSGKFHGLAWHPDGHWLVAGASDRTIYVYDTQSGALFDRLTGHADTVTAVAWSPDGTTLASTAGGPLLQLSLVDVSDGPDQAIRLWRWR
jgi:WD40 repeat protein